MENQTERRNNTDEIDLAQFFRWIGRGFSGFGNSLIYGMASLRKQFFDHRLFFLGVIILGLILGGLYAKLLSRKYYKSSMILSCDYLNTQSLKNTIDKFNLLAGQDGGLQELLKIDSNTAKHIQKFEFKSFVSEDDVVEVEVLREQLNNVTAEKRDLVDRVIDRLEIADKNAYEISVFVYDPTVVKPLEAAIVNYFENNDYIKRRIESHRRNLEDRKDKLLRESRKLDSLKLLLLTHFGTLADKSRGSNNVIMNDETLASPLEVFTTDLELHEELQEVEEELYLSPDFELVDGFTTFKQPESASFGEILFGAFLISILIGYLILGALRFDRMLATYPSRKSVTTD